MADAKENTSAKKGIIARSGGAVGRYFIKRTATGPAIGMTFTKMKSDIARVSRVEQIDRAKINKTLKGHEDGGRALFVKNMEEAGLDEEDLKDIAFTQRLYAIVFVLGMIGFFLMSIRFVLQGYVGWGLVSLPASFALGALWFRHSFLAWQVRSRRFGSITEFLRS